MEIISLISNVFKLLKNNEKLFALILFIMVLFSSFFEMFALSLMLPLFQFLFDIEANKNFLTLIYYIKFYSDLISLDAKIFFSLLVMFMLGLALILKTIYIIINERFAQIFSNRLVFELFDKVYNSDFSWSRNQNSANVIQRVIQDSGSISQGTIATSAELAYQMLIGLIGFISIVYLLNITALLYLILVMVIVIMLIFYVSPIIKQLTNVIRINQFKVIEDGAELFRAMRFLKTSKNEMYASNISKKLFAKGNKSRRNLTIITRVFPAIILLLGQLLIIIFVLNLILMPSQGASQIINMSFVGLILARLLPSISSISSYYNRLVKLIPYLDGYKKLNISLKNNYIINDNKNEKRIYYSWKTFKIENLSYKLDKKNVLFENISLEFKRNKVYGFVGPSGVGKTTLMDIISGLITPEKGSLILDNKTISDRQKKNWLLEIGYASQDPIIFDKNFIENISLNPKKNISENSINRIIETVSLKNLLDEKNKSLNYNLGEQGINISGGQRQRVGIARAIYKNPTFLILDEATSGMDRSLENQIRKNVKKIISKPTIIIISHNVETLRNCDFIIFFKNDREIKLEKFSSLSKDKQFKKLLIKEKH